MTTWLADTTGLQAATVQNILLTLIAIVIVWLLRRAVLRVALSRATDARLRYRWHKSSSYVGLGVAALAILRIWFQGMGNLITLLGLVSAGLAIALQSLIVGLAGWLFILVRKPFVVGDRVEIQGIIGDVVDQGTLQFTLLEVGNWVGAEQSTGRLVHVPNGLVFTAPVANYHRPFPFIWVEMPVLVTFESNWRDAKDILAEIVRRVTAPELAEAEEQMRDNRSGYLIEQGTLTPIVYTSVEDSGVLLTLRHLVRPRQRRVVTEALWEELLDAFAQRTDIDLAYPTRRVYNNRTEGKVDARAND